MPATFRPYCFARMDKRICSRNGGPLLGALEGAEFQSGELMLEPGDTLVAYSDGVLECRNLREKSSDWTG